MPFVVTRGGQVSVWGTDDYGDSLQLLCADPRRRVLVASVLKFNFDGSPASSTCWVPATHIPDHRVTFVEQLEDCPCALVNPLDPTATRCRRLLLSSGVDREESHLVPSGW